MADLFDKQAAIYVDARPRYPSEWFSMLASLTSDHSLAWDAGTGNGQAAIDVSIFSLKLSKYIEIWSMLILCSHLETPFYVVQ